MTLSRIYPWEGSDFMLAMNMTLKIYILVRVNNQNEQCLKRMKKS